MNGAKRRPADKESEKHHTLSSRTDMRRSISIFHQTVHMDDGDKSRSVPCMTAPLTFWISLVV